MIQTEVSTDSRSPQLLNTLWGLFKSILGQGFVAQEVQTNDTSVSSFQLHPYLNPVPQQGREEC